MRSSIVVGLAFVVMAIVFISGGLMKGIEVEGHRGARARRPENTLAAFDYALEAGVNTLEMDVNISKDGEAVVIHEAIIPSELCLGPDGQPAPEGLAIHSLDLATIKTFDCGSVKDPNYPDQIPVPGEKIPTLREVFELVKNSSYPIAKKVRFNIETKIRPDQPDLAPSPEEFVSAVLKVVEEYSMVDRTVLQSFDPRTLLAAKEQEPKLALSILLLHDFPDLVMEAKKLGVNIVSPNKDWITQEKVKMIHAAKMKVIPWTANAPEDWDRLISMGVDGIITDDPERLIQYLQERGLRRKAS